MLDNRDPCTYSYPEVDKLVVTFISFFKFRNSLSCLQTYGALKLMAFKKEELLGNANERIPWHENLDGEEAIQKRVHE